MAQIEITENKYNVICDTYGCNNPAPFVVGKAGEGQAQKVLYCKECLQGIINAAPIEMIMERPGLKEYFEVLAAERAMEEEVGKAQTGDLSEMKFNDLKEIAINKGFDFKVGTSKAELIAFIEGKP